MIIINRFLQSLVRTDLFNRIPAFILTSGILILAYLSFDLDANEEQYMLYAKYFMDPEWIVSESLSEFAGTRLIYQYIIGFALIYSEFESVVFIGRLILCLLFGWGLIRIYRQLKISNVGILLHLPILYLSLQSLYGGSWIFISLEPKDLAWVFVLFAFGSYLKESYKWMTIHLLAASYLHILVGGFSSIYLFLSVLLLDKASLKNTVRMIFLYVVAVTPFLIYLSGSLGGTIDYEPSSNWIYTYFRSPHHTALIRDWGYFYSKHFYGIIYSMIALFFSCYCFTQYKDSVIRKLAGFIIVSLAGCMFFVLVALFDREGVILKFYPFRIMALSTLMLFLLVTYVIFIALSKSELHFLMGLILLLGLISVLKLSIPNVRAILSYQKVEKNESLTEMTSFIKNNTPKESIILSFYDDLSLTRRMERERFSVYKFIPAEMRRIPDWYERVLIKRKLAKDLGDLEENYADYKFDYILSGQVLDHRSLELIFSNDRLFLYQLKL